MSLSSLIVQREIATIREVEEAMARQVLYGGDFVTNLFEVSRIEESAILPVVAESYGLAPAPVGELPKVEGAAARLVAKEVAAERSFLPLGLGESLVIAVAEPLGPEAEQELTFALALPIEQRIAPLFRIRQALARDYGIPIDKRTARLITKVIHRGPRMSSTLPPPRESNPAFLAAPRPPSIAPPPPRASLEPPRTAATALGTLVRNMDAQPPRPPRRRRGPLTLEVAVEELEASAERDVIFDVLFEFARQFFDYTTLFIVHGELAEGRDAFGDGASRDKVARIGVPLDVDNLLSATRKAKKTVRRRPSADGLDAILMADLGRTGGTECIVFPIIVRTRVVAMLMGDGGASGIDDAGVRQLESLISAAAGAFERVIMRRKLKGGEAGPPGGGPSRPAASVAPPATQLSASSAAERPARGRPSGRPTDEELAPPVRELSADPASDVVITTREPTPLAFLTSGPLSIGSDRPPPANILAVRRPSGRPIPREEPGATLSVELPPAPPPLVIAPTPVSVSPPPRVGAPQRGEAPRFDFGSPSVPSVVTESAFGTDPIERQLIAQIQGDGAAPGAPGEPPKTTRDPDPTSRAFSVAPQSPRAESPPPMRVAESVDDAPTPVSPSVFTVEDPASPPAAPASASTPEVAAEREARVEPVLSLSHRKGAPPPMPKVEPKPMPASEQQISVAAHRPPSSRSDGSRALPSVIVDISTEYVNLVKRVIAGPDDEAEIDLLRGGGYAMPAIMAKFPGPTSVDPERLGRGPLPRVGECGPVLRLVASQRRTALPFVLSHVESRDPVRRFWATYLLTELLYPDSVAAAVGRVFDEDERVRRAARAATRALAEAHPFLVIDRLSAIARSDREPTARRVEAIEALGESREVGAVAALIPALGTAAGEVAVAVHVALVAITRQDFGLDGKRWSIWWEDHKTRHRIEWLIDSLNHDQRALRGAASEELRELTKEFFGYHDDLSKRERAQAQARYREWWESVGRVRFSRAATRGG